mmetsp:Transcript_5160/g.9813  ORF Transcript_5160/g.9813 Transcript_5160/m.9813 type:complete len:250 (+) Transcript_5160:145-894(+)
MTWGLTQAAVLEFASRPFIQRAMSAPHNPVSVLSFYFGMDMLSEESRAVVKTGSYISDMEPFWFVGNEHFDKLCTSFSSVVRDAGKREFTSNRQQDAPADDDNCWDSVNGKLAQLILCDQLARNCFRGTDEAFAYDHYSLEIAKDLASIALSDDPDFYGSYTFFLVLAFMHSEDLEDHKLGKLVLDKAKETCPSVNWDQTESYLLQHTKVIEQFGRYPHRNEKMKRITTPEEEEWLNSPDVPRWAKSQG